MTTPTRPALTARYWTWKDHDRNETPGVGLWSGNGRLKAHLTYAEARALADQLHDMADRLEGAAS